MVSKSNKIGIQAKAFAVYQEPPLPPTTTKC